MIRRSAALASLFVLAQTVAGISSQPRTSPFPHERHNRVFPVCEGCHAGIVNGDADQVFPRVEDCQRCHDGTRVKRVEWRERAPRVSLLRFSHVSHNDVASVGAEPITCQTCHAITGASQRMSVAGPNPDRCVSCHANASREHIAPDAGCRTCHVPIAEQPRMPASRVAAFPKPAWHGTPGFQSAHGRVTDTQSASCAVCHARESCERCHANAAKVPLIASLARDARIAGLIAGRTAEYPTPRSHQSSEWRTAHGRRALDSTASCANCHTRPSCARCHVGGESSSRAAVVTLPGPDVWRGLGVSPARITSAVHSMDFPAKHRTAAAAGSLACAQCHTQQTCGSCHVAQESRQFHADNFVERHAVDVFASAVDCQSCHNTERFCRECHARNGIASSGRMNAAFHTGQATWVLSHGQAARTGMESCASCHKQTDCVRCHSATGGWGVNPHRPGFRAGALAERNASSCRWCHVSTPPGGR